MQRKENNKGKDAGLYQGREIHNKDMCGVQEVELRGTEFETLGIHHPRRESSRGWHVQVSSLGQNLGLELVELRVLR